MTNPNTYNRSISYLRPQWSENRNHVLQEAFAKALSTLQTVEDTRFSLDRREAEIQHRKEEAEEIYLHISSWTPGEPASTVPHRAQSANIDLESVPAGKEWDYLDSDGMVMITGNHCFILPNRMRIQSIERYLRIFLFNAREKGSGLPDDVEAFRLLPVLSREMAKLAMQEGIKKVDLRLSAYAEALKFRTSILGRLFGKHESRASIAEGENLSVGVSIGLDTRRKGIEPSELVPMLETLESTDEGTHYTVITRTGREIRDGEMKLSKPVELTAYNKAISHDEAWMEMLNYKKELESEGEI